MVEKRVQGATNTDCAALSYAGTLKAQLLYDPLGRLVQVWGESTGTRKFVYDGNAMIAEYDGNDVVLRRYVHGSNAEADDPLIWYEGSTLTDRRYLHADTRGSIIAVTDGAGALLQANTYDEYGIPDGDSLGDPTGTGITTRGRFRYTGQVWLPELEMYYYKARIYSPKLGRFLQTDPIGYEDQFNLYAYVGNDPVNSVDPMGLCTFRGDATEDTPESDICKVTSQLQTSTDGQRHIIGFEGIIFETYQETGDVPTIGIGHTKGVKHGDKMTMAEIYDTFQGDLEIAESAVKEAFGSLPLSQSEFDAWVDVAFNVGENSLKPNRSPSLGRAIAAKDYGAIAAEVTTYGNGPSGMDSGLGARSGARGAMVRGDYSTGVKRWNEWILRVRREKGW